MIDIIKADGEKQKFKKEKLERSLKRVGVRPELIKKVSGEVVKIVKPEISSEKILNKVTSELKKERPILAGRYNLKRAIMELGPTGFPFERYISEILKEYGYNTRVGIITRGYCVDHEIDVIAKKDQKHFMIECKYHNRPGIKSNVKTALYIYARFLDVKKSWEKIPGHSNLFHQPWLVTNTKCTSQAIKYAACAGLRIISWRYPKSQSLEYLIEKKGLYPITTLPSLTRFSKERLAQKNLMMAKDLLKYSAGSLSRLTGIKPRAVEKLQKEAEELCLPRQKRAE